MKVYTVGGLVGLGHGATHWIIGAFYFLLPFIADDLNLSYIEAGAFATIFQIASFSANIISGPVVDMTGRRVLWQAASLLIGTAALFFVSEAAGYVGLVIAMVFIGATNNLWHPAAISYLSNRFRDQRGLALSLHALGANIGDAVAPLLLGPVLLIITWRETAAWASLPPVIVAIALVLFLKRSQKQEAKSATTPKESKVSGSDYIAGLKALLKNKLVLILCVMSGFRNMAQQGLLVFLPLYLLNDMQLSPEMMGLALFAFQGAGIMAAPIAGGWSDKIGRRPVVMSGLVLTTVILLGLTLLNNPIAFVIGISIMGFGLFAIRPVVHSWLMDMTPDEMGGSATSLMFGIQSLLAMVSPIIGGYLADEYGLISAFYFLGGAMLIANVIVMILPNEKPAN
ncbi:MFS transporter [Curvivirga sp.]|uniref:MFS transporter n=1 Tax=Curvivirga sp. TaxID=2856848 RepID=UPI003B5A40AB